MTELARAASGIARAVMQSGSALPALEVLGPGPWRGLSSPSSRLDAVGTHRASILWCEVYPSSRILKSSQKRR
jgi:hypothetical protein